MEPTTPDPIAAAHRLHATFPARPIAIATALKRENFATPKMPVWREKQTLGFLRIIGVYAGDVDSEYRSRRPDLLAGTVRKLIEVSIWIQYCNSSETRARTFYNDSARDGIDQLKVLSELYASENGRPDERLQAMIEGLRASAIKDGFNDVDRKFTNVRDAAAEIGRSAIFRGLYKVFSKMAHPTALMLNFEPQLSLLLDSFYVGGEFFCRRGVEELEAFIRGFHPSLELNAHGTASPH